MRSLRALPAVTLVAVVALAATPAAHAAFPGRNGRLAVGWGFGCDGSMIATMKPDGSARRLLTPSACRHDNAPDVRAPDWFADGSRMALLRGAAPATMNADGSGLARIPLADRPFFGEDKPSISRSGRQILFTRFRPSPRGRIDQIWRARLDGTRAHKIRNGSGARFSPDGRRIAYIAPGGGVWLMNARTGARIRRVARSATSLDWSPNGHRLVLAASRPNSDNLDLYVARADGRGVRRLTFTRRRSELEPVFSPDGDRIAYVRVRQRGETREQFSIFTIGVRGGRHRRIYRSEVLETEEVLDPPSLSWRPR